MSNKNSFYLRSIGLSIACKMLGGDDWWWILLGATMISIIVELYMVRYTWALPSTAMIGGVLIAMGLLRPQEHVGIIMYDWRLIFIGIVHIAFVALLVYERRILTVPKVL